MLKSSFNARTILASIFIAASATFAANAQTITPISLSGFNYDIVVGVGETGAAYNYDFGHGQNYHFFEAGLTGSPAGYGLPASGTFVSSANSNVEFGFAPYDGNNVAIVSDSTDFTPPTSVTLTLSTPAEYTALSFLDTSDNGGGGTFTLNFSDNTSVEIGSAFTADVYSGQAGILANIGSQTGTAADPGYYTGPTALYEQDFTVPLADQSKTIDSITINYTGGNEFYLFSVSGEAVPEPSTWAMFGLGTIGMLFVMRRRRALFE